MSFVILNPQDCSLDVTLEDNNLTARKLQNKALGLTCGGVRANVGITTGKFYFIVKLLRATPVNGTTSSATTCFLGVSERSTDVGLLGMVPHSFAISSAGNILTGQQNGRQLFKLALSPPDEIGVFLDMDCSPGQISFTRNGQWLGTAIPLPHLSSPGSALFPHVVLQNMVVRVNFVDTSLQQDGFKPWTSALSTDGCTVIPSAPAGSGVRSEVLMIIGPNFAGKSTWVERHIAENPGKRYVVLGFDSVCRLLRVNLDPQMTISSKAKTRADVNSALQALMERAPAVQRNYILDDVNGDEAVRSRILAKFSDAMYLKRAVVVIVPETTLAVRRQQGMVDGRPAAILYTDENVLANRLSFTLPKQGEFKDINYVEEKPPAATKIVEELRNRASQRKLLKRPSSEGLPLPLAKKPTVVQPTPLTSVPESPRAKPLAGYNQSTKPPQGRGSAGPEPVGGSGPGEMPGRGRFSGRLAPGPVVLGRVGDFRGRAVPGSDEGSDNRRPGRGFPGPARSFPGRSPVLRPPIQGQAWRGGRNGMDARGGRGGPEGGATGSGRNWIGRGPLPARTASPAPYQSQGPSGGSRGIPPQDLYSNGRGRGRRGGRADPIGRSPGGRGRAGDQGPPGLHGFVPPSGPRLGEGPSFAPSSSQSGVPQQGLPANNNPPFHPNMGPRPIAGSRGLEDLARPQLQTQDPQQGAFFPGRIMEPHPGPDAQAQRDGFGAHPSGPQFPPYGLPAPEVGLPNLALEPGGQGPPGQGNMGHYNQYPDQYPGMLQPHHGGPSGPGQGMGPSSVGERPWDSAGTPMGMHQGGPTAGNGAAPGGGMPGMYNEGGYGVSSGLGPYNAPLPEQGPPGMGGFAGPGLGQEQSGFRGPPFPAKSLGGVDGGQEGPAVRTLEQPGPNQVFAPRGIAMQGPQRAISPGGRGGRGRPAFKWEMEGAPAAGVPGQPTSTSSWMDPSATSAPRDPGQPPAFGFGMQSAPNMGPGPSQPVQGFMPGGALPFGGIPQATQGLAAPPSHMAQPFQHNHEGNSFLNMPAQPYGQDPSAMAVPPSNNFFYGGQL
eukprot:jgi/Botrbrau1/19691/Bobra.0003s0052.1